MFQNVVTLSLNPAIDVTLWLEELVINGANSVAEERFDAAGKAMNVSRMLKAFGVDSHAIVVAGKHNLHAYQERLQNEGVDCEYVLLDGYIRENITLVLPDKTQTRILREGCTVEYEAVEEVCNRLKKCVGNNTLVVISGQLPKGVSSSVLKLICNKIYELGGKIALDTVSVSLEDLYEIRPWVIKPNYAEFCQYVGCAVESEEQLIDCAVEMNQHGIEHVLVSLGNDGLLYTGEEACARVEVPVIDVVSSVGAGDCVLGGFIKAMRCGGNIYKCICTAAAAGTAACLTEGTNPPTKIAMANILQQVNCRILVRSNS